VEYVPLEPTVMAPEGAVVRLAAKTAVAKELIETKKRMMMSVSSEGWTI
jgi:hypothetical protein